MSIHADVRTLGEALERRARVHGGLPAVVWRDRVVTWSELDALASRFAGGLRREGVEAADIVALAARNVPELLISYFGVQKLGASALLLNIALNPAELAAILADARPRVLVHQDVLNPLVQALPQHAPRLVTPRLTAPPPPSGEPRPATEMLVVTIGEEVLEGAVPFERLTEGNPVKAGGSEPGDVSTILYKAGADGVPKGVMLTHRNLLHQGAMIRDGLTMDPDDVTLLVLPLYHIFAVGVVVQSTLLAGSTVVLQERFEPEAVLGALERHGVTLFYGVPTMYVMLLRQAAQGERTLPDTLRVAICGAAPLPVDVAERFEATFGSKLVEGYGLTEAAGATAVNPWFAEIKMGTIGIAIPGNEMRVVDESGEPVGPGEPGELVVRGPNVMRGYLRRPDATAKAVRDGWLHTGDIGSVDEDGYYSVLARKNDLIIVGGENVYPREVERALREHPSVEDAGVAGAQHGLMGEVPEAWVVPADGSLVESAALVDHARERLAKFKVPRTIHVVDVLPRDDDGELVRSALLEMREASSS